MIASKQLIIRWNERVADGFSIELTREQLA
jgi:hypothetical protein